MSGKRVVVSTVVSIFGLVTLAFFTMGGDGIAQEPVVMKVTPEQMRAMVPQQKLQTIPGEVEGKLAESLGLSPCRAENAKKKLAVAFVVDSDGQIHELSNCQQFETAAGKPIPARAIKEFQGISLFVTENPKVCWRSTSGYIRCVSY